MGFDPTQILIDDGELPPLYLALSQRDFEKAAKLISAGAKLDDLIEDDGTTLLHFAADGGDIQMVEFYLDHDCPKSLESFDCVERTPLIAAAETGRTDVVVRLLSARVNPNANDEDRIGNTAIREAVRGGHKDLVALLLRAGADPTIPGWMAISAVDQAWYEIEGSPETVKEIQTMLAKYPSTVRDSKEK